VYKFVVKKNNVKEKIMQKGTSLTAVVFALVVLLVSTSGVFAQVQLAHFDVLSPPESCVICHSGAGEKKHQEIYDNYSDASSLKLTIDSVTSVSDGAGAFNATMTFTIMKNGVAYIDADGLPSLEQKRFYAVTYDSATRQFDNSKSFSNPVALGNGQYSVTATGIPYDLNNSSGEAYAYIADGPLETEGMLLYDDVANAGLAFGDAATYESAANVAGCEKCHGTPYMKHGYRAAEVEGLPDFAACKTCHYDTRNSGHEDWQILVDNPARYAEIHAGDAKTDDEKTQYAYKARIMNDVHMSHAMEFPYPQSMSNCATCHEGKLDKILTDANYKLETCLSCHPLTGPEEGTESNRPPALASVMPHGTSLGKCNACHAEGSIAPLFSEIHTGYNKEIYADAAGTKYSDIFSISIDSASIDGNNLTIAFSAVENGNTTTLSKDDIVPSVMVGLYGYDTKDFIVAAHGRDADGNRLLEYPVDGETVNPRFTTVSAEGGSWEVIADLSMWVDMLADGTVKRAEISVLPALKDADGETVALNAPSRTFDFGANAFDDGFYSDIVDVENGCNSCHDALATTFHSGNRGGNIKVCRTCHVTLSGGSHLEMQSRSIDSYVHAIHSFQAFDIGDVNFADPVEALRYDLHVEHVYPNFTIKNCESCHHEGTFEVPDQSKSLPGLLSGSDSIETWDRNIGNVPAYITGPGSRACGACHRAEFIKEDAAGELVSFFQHTKQGGYLIEEGADSDETQGLLMTVISYIMALFK
jgi:OmcA/MtrC family decaheme c-type cytochrome